MIFTLLATTASAADKFGVVTLELRPERGGAPTHLCVVAGAKGTRTRMTLQELLQPLESADQSERSGTWLVDPKAWGGEAGAVERYRCADGDLGDCRPRVELPSGLQRLSDLHVACIADGLLESDEREGVRPLFVLLEHLGGSPPSIESIRLVGGVATVGVAADLERVVVTARSLGGFYLPHKVSERAESETVDATATQGSARKQVGLTLQSRCRLVEITLPRTRLSLRDRDRLSVRVHGMDLSVDRCVEGQLDDTPVVQIRVPPAPLGVGSIEVELAATESGKTAAKFGASYRGAWPQTPFPLTFKQVTFAWRRPKCIYPEASCPAASLETGTACESTLTEEGCAYTCPGAAREDALDLELPLTVHFEKEDPTQKWTDRLAQNGQLLTSYVDADDIYVQADISRWKTEDPANRITGIELFTEDGGTLPRGVTGIKKLQLKVPGASCEPLRFRPVGDRDYADEIATIADGQIEFGRPERMAKRLSVSMMVAIGGGPAWSGLSDPGASPPVYFNGIGMFALQYRPRARGWSRIGFEGRVGMTLGRWGALVEEGAMEPEVGALEDTAPETNEQRFAQARVLVEPGVVIAAHDRFGVGAGFGLGASFPIREAQDLTQERIEFVWSPSLDGRFYIQRWIGLVLQVRGVFGERAFGVVEDAPDPDGGIETDPTTRASKARSLLALFGAVIRF
ncbi:MAG: hypothetical protein AAF721_15065 [Myxococcota bacterium]